MQQQVWCSQKAHVRSNCTDDKGVCSLAAAHLRELQRSAILPLYTEGMGVAVQG